MKKGLLFIALMAFSILSFARGGESYWNSTVKNSSSVMIENKSELTNFKLYELNFDVLKSTVVNSPKRNSGLKSSVEISFPDADGNLNSFSVYENSNMDPALEANYPDIKSYVGIGISDPSAVIYFSMSPLGLQTMQINSNKSAVIIEPYTTTIWNI